MNDDMFDARTYGLLAEFDSLGFLPTTLIIDYVSPKESKMVNPKIGISEYVTCPPQSWIYVEGLK